MLVFSILAGNVFSENEVLTENTGKVIVRKHTKTGKPYAALVFADLKVDPRIEDEVFPVSRPDYRMLDPQAKSSDFHYEGPVSDRKKIYIFAGTLAALGAAGGIAGALAPAASSGGAAGGAGLFAGASALTVAGSAELVIRAHANSSPGDYESLSESHIF